jgi:hypothetical protein
MDRALHHDAFWRFTSARELADALELVVRAAEPRGKPLLRAA